MLFLGQQKIHFAAFGAHSTAEVLKVNYLTIHQHPSTEEHFIETDGDSFRGVGRQVSQVGQTRGPGLSTGGVRDAGGGDAGAGGGAGETPWFGGGNLQKPTRAKAPHMLQKFVQKLAKCAFGASI